MINAASWVHTGCSENWSQGVVLLAPYQEGLRDGVNTLK